MSVLANLTDEECYLLAILTDTSGLDLAEFALTDETTPDNVWRAWPFQWPWFRCDDVYQIDLAARSVGKSYSVRMRCLAFPFNYPGEEMALTAPEFNLLELLTDKIENAFLNNRLFSYMLSKGTGSKAPIRHKPWSINFQNESRIVGKIPQRDGRGFKGMHPLILESDESQDLTEKSWNEIMEVLKRETDEGRKRWRIHGVTRGVRDHFYRFTQPESLFTVHRLPAMYRPTWSELERDEKVELYRGKDSPDYRRNVLGLHGDSTSSVFVLSRLMQCVDKNSESPYNTTEYCFLDIDEAQIREVESIEYLLDGIPASHKKFKDIWIGMDVGFTLAPSAICVFTEIKPKATGPTVLKLITRILLTRVKHEDQVRCILHLMDLYKPLAFALDRTGVGLPLFQDIQHRAQLNPVLSKHIDRIKGYNFSEKVIVGFDETTEEDQFGTSTEHTEIRKNVLEFSTDLARGLVDDARLQLPDDRELLGEFQGQTWQYSSSLTSATSRRRIYCVDDTTEILTDRGWMGVDSIQGGDMAWSYDTEDQKGCWTVISDVNEFNGTFDMVRLKSTMHDSMTSLDHRWAVERLRNDHACTRYWHAFQRFYTTENLPNTSRHRIPCAVEPKGLPSIAKYADSFVELVAWFFCEGSAGREGPKQQMSLNQSRVVNPLHCRDIENALDKEAPSEWGMTQSFIGPAAGMNTYRIRKGSNLRSQLSSVCVGFDKVINPSFLLDLTYSQLELFINTCLRGDGWVSHSRSKMSWDRSSPDARSYDCLDIGFSQKNQCNTDLFSMACAMFGVAVSHNSHTTTTPGGDTYPMHGCSIKMTTGVGISSMKKTPVIHEGRVWCPTTETGTWLARRNGTVFFTGNSSGSYHSLDAARMAVLAWHQHEIDAFLKAQEQHFVPAEMEFIY